MVRSKRRLGLKNFDPCTILLNNDLTAGTPGILEDLHEQYLLPPLHAGWAIRRKTNHFQAYEEVAKKFAKLLGMDPWLINPLFTRCGEGIRGFILFAHLESPGFFQVQFYHASEARFIVDDQDAFFFHS